MKDVNNTLGILLSNLLASSRDTSQQAVNLGSFYELDILRQVLCFGLAIEWAYI